MKIKVVAAIAGCLLAVAGHAQTVPFDIADYKAALDALHGRLAGGSFPRPQDAVVVAAVRRIEAAEQAIDSPALPVSGMDTFQSVCVPGMGMMGEYGSRAVTAAMAAAPTAAARERARRDGVDGIFLPNVSAIFPMLKLSVKCSLAHMSFFATYFRDLPPEQVTEARRKGARDIRDGLFQQVDGAVRMTAQPAMGAERQRALLEMLARYSPQIGETLSAPQKAAVIAVIMKARFAWPAAGRADGAVLLKALRSNDCSALCAA